MMKLDLRRPSIVVTGAWNPAIFQPGWILRFLFQVAEGQTEKVSQLYVTEDPPKAITYARNVGLAALPHRLEFYLNADVPEAKALLEDVVKRAVETLPHTPIGALGLNYHFSTEDPEEAVDDKLKARDNIDQFYKVKTYQIMSIIEYSEGVDLNFRRDVTATGAEFDFNYHHNKASAEKIKFILSGYYDKLLSASVTSLKKLYDLDKFDVLTHQLEI